MIAVIGSTNTDMVISGSKIPVPGETVSSGTFMMNPGGKGANQAVAVARLSKRKGSCVFIAKVGDDVFGRDTAVRMKKDGIDASIAVVFSSACALPGRISTLHPAACASGCA